ncbi:hypothetical protein K435DRAFT_339963 [Dendrothele bispora CBS 962.96]|uniref:Phytocyanin domain-containing protein n=1 Tax=Dendrothele bispora (strain CBS 962.96) TaxID=1314807 RepID=A0A4S8MIV3_DENBC|nr:hypothetical protein K435DRAFT_339963 [Dendrothele bispora CBS 962.96]
MKSLLLLPLGVSSVSAAVFTVGVGKDENTGHKGIGFDPSVIYPVAGDEIVFEFRSGQHSVVQSSYEKPCTPKDDGFDTGVQTVPDSTPVDANGLPTVTLSVSDTQPMWFFDQAAGTCQQGGVLAVNPAGTQTPAGFKENAANQLESETVVSTDSSSSSNSGSSSSTSPTTTATSPAGVIASSAATSPCSTPFLTSACAAFLGLSVVLAWN